MGQYHILVNLSKKQYVHPHDLDSGAKALEQVGFKGSTADILMALIAGSCKGGERGGGDFQAHKLVGSWAGDRIALIGDYAESNDIEGMSEEDIKSIYKICNNSTLEDGWKNISLEVKKMWKKAYY